MKELCVSQPVASGFYSRQPHFCIQRVDSQDPAQHQEWEPTPPELRKGTPFQPPQTLGLLGLEVCRPCIQIRVVRSLNCTMTPLPGTAVPPWSPTNVAAIMTVTGLLSSSVATEALAVLGQTSLSPESIKHTDFLLDLGASQPTIPLCFRLSSN